jgi:hypothetical protein
MRRRDYVPFDFSWFCKNQAGVTVCCELAFVPAAGILRQPFRRPLPTPAVKAAA